MNDLQTFGKWLRHRRRELDLTQEELARKTGCAPITIRKLEADEMRPSKQLADLLMQQLEVAPDQRQDFARLARTGNLPAARGVEPHNNLPSPISRFIGRSRELSEVPELVSSSRLVTLTGPGGTGKTRLAIEVSAHILGNFSDGIWLIDFVPLHESGLVQQIVAIALGVREEPNRPLIQSIEDFLHSKNCMLIFDNCEHLIAQCAETANRLLQACPQLRILATSRESLGVIGEQQVQVSPLSLPDAKSASSLEETQRSEAVQVFVDRAALVQPSFSLSASNAGDVLKICRQLDGIPLAIELAAARLRGLSVQQLSAHLDRGFQLLSAGNRAAFPRQHTLHATIDWSYNLLSDVERTMLGRLSVFSGGWTLDAAISVCTAGAVQSDAVAGLLGDLADKSLVVVQEYAPEPRYRFLEIIREYASMKLIEAGESDTVRAQHLGYYMELCEQAEHEYRSRDQVRWFGSMEKERDNLRSALEFVLPSNQPELALRMVGTAVWLWFFRGSWSEGETWVGNVLSQSNGDHSAARAKATLGLGMLQFAQSKYVDAARVIESSLGMWRALKEKWWCALALNFLALIVRSQDAAKASQMLHEGLKLATELNDNWMLSFCLWNVGEDKVYQEDLPQAQGLLERSLELAKDLGDRLLQNESLRALGEIAEAEKRYAAAVDLYAESLAIIQALGDTTNISVLHFDLGRALQLAGRADEAEEHFIEAASWSIRLGKKTGLLRALAGLGVIEARRGDAHRSAKLFAASNMQIGADGVKPAFRVHAHQLAWIVDALALDKKKLGEERFAAAWTEGLAMNQERAVQYALEGI